MAKIALLKIDEKTGAVKAVTGFSNDAEALASIKTKGTYAVVEVHEVEPKKAAKAKENE